MSAGDDRKKPEWYRAPGILCCEALDEATLLLRERWDYLSLDPIAHRIWQLLAKPRRTDELVDLLTREYRVAPDRCRADLEPLLATLHDAGALTKAAATPA